MTYACFGKLVNSRLFSAQHLWLMHVLGSLSIADYFQHNICDLCMFWEACQQPIIFSTTFVTYACFGKLVNSRLFSAQHLWLTHVLGSLSLLLRMLWSCFITVSHFSFSFADSANNNTTCSANGTFTSVVDTYTTSINTHSFVYYN